MRKDDKGEHVEGHVNQTAKRGRMNRLSCGGWNASIIAHLANRGGITACRPSLLALSHAFLGLRAESR